MSDRTAEALMKMGFRAVEEHDYKRAKRIGKRLRDLRHTSSFEILALAYAEEGRLKKAVEALEEGVSYAPSVWRLWQLLGNYYSDQGRYDDAFNAYRSALACPQTYPASINLNIAILLSRQKRYVESLDVLEQVTDEDLYLPVMAVRTESLNALERYEETLALASDFLDTEAETEQERHFLARLLTALALAYWKGRNDKEGALLCLKAALEWDKNCQKAFWLLRQLDGEISPSAKYYRVLVEGVWPEPFEGETVAPGFFTSYDVVADSREEALAYIRRIEPDEVGESLRIEEAKALEKRPDEPKGVYAAGPYSLFPGEKSKKKPSKTK
ncbi:MAG: tetratricopeptide repeat protein [Armatimonadetes bacterium]|nr:tetratricopeptide repeat protein [Armatimonadota bacterium]